MSLAKTLSTQYWNSIPKKCKNCSKSIYTIEDKQVYYQCSMYGKFKKDCELQLITRELPKPQEIIKLEND